jgi:hypothetical protein
MYFLSKKEIVESQVRNEKAQIIQKPSMRAI